MRIHIVGFIALMASLTHFLIFCESKESPLFLPEIIDYPHQLHINALFEKADAAKYAQDYKKADAEFNRLLNEKLSTADSQYVFNQLAFIHLAMNNDAVAEQYIRKLEKISPLSERSVLDSLSEQADYHYNIGTLAYHTFKPAMAKQHLQAALAAYQKVYGEQHLKTALCWTQLGLLNWDFTTKLDSVFWYMEKADNIFKNQPSLKKFSQEAELGLACVSLAKRSHETGQLHCEIALNMAYQKRFKDSVFIARCLSMKGNMLKKKAQGEGDSAKRDILLFEADSCYRKAVEIVKNSSTLRVQEFYRDYIISKCWEKDSSEVFKNIAVLEKMLLTQPDIFAQPERLKGKYYFLTDNFSQAAYWYAKFWERYRTDTLKNAILMGELNYCLMEAYTKIGKYDDALYFLNKDLTLGTPYESKNISWEQLLTPVFYKEKLYQFVTFGEAGKIFLSKYQAQHRISDLNNALKVLKLTDELLFEGILTADEEAILTYQKEVANEIYPLALDVVYELNMAQPNNSATLDLAFRYSERVKAFLLYRDLVQENTQSNIPLSMADSIKNITSKINRLRWDNQHNKLKMNDLETLKVLQQQLDNCYEVIKQQYPRYFKIKIAQPIPTIKEVMTTLRPHQGVIQYSFHKEKLYALLVVNGQAFFHRLDSTKRLIANVQEYVNYLYRPINNADYNKKIIQIAQQLNDDLLGYFTRQLKGTTDLLIIPDKTLNNLPFEALIEPSKEIVNSFTHAAFLQKRLNVTYTPSWKIYENNHTGTLPLTPQILTMTYGETTDEGYLPNAMAEINILKLYFKDPQLKILTNSDCSKSHFFDNFSTFDIIHLALHAYSNVSDRRDNKIYFTLPISDEMYGFELLNHSFKTQLVVLSACETAIGKTETGEGTYSLSRAFLQSGVKNVVASLWKLDDYVASQLFDTFYAELSKNQPPYLALNKAKRHFLEQNRQDAVMSNPAYWAGLMILD